MWLNIVFLMAISAIPFSAGLIGEYPREPDAIRVYCGNPILAGIVLFGQLRYAAGRGQFFDHVIDARYELVRGGEGDLVPVARGASALSLLQVYDMKIDLIRSAGLDFAKRPGPGSFGWWDRSRRRAAPSGIMVRHRLAPLASKIRLRGTLNAGRLPVPRKTRPQ